MTLVFNHHPYKYEMESVCKLFFTGVLFQHEYDSDELEREDLIITELRREENQTNLIATIRQGGTARSDCCTVENAAPDYHTRCERMMATALYRVLSAHTGIRPPWGMMTGIRPVKQYRYLLEQGKTAAEADRVFTEDFFVEPKKLQLCQIIDRVQQPIIEESASDSYSLYVSIPFCPTRCSYCSFVSSSIAAPKAKALVEEYLQLLCKELELLGSYAKQSNLRLETVYIGGGTPTTLSAEQLERLIGCISTYFPLHQAREFTVEAGRADTITRDKLEVIRRLGATRISINPQTFSDEVLQTIGRKHTAQQVVDCYQLALDCGLSDINMDLIAGLPGDTLEQFRKTLDQTLSLSPTNITVHTLTLKRSSDLFTQGVGEEQMQIAQMVEEAYQRLSAAGYIPYYLYRQKNTLQNLENIGYCKPGYESRYNIYIMEEIHSILAAGAGAVSKLIRNQSQKVERIFNYKYPFEYNKGFDEIQERKKAVLEFYQN